MRVVMRFDIPVLAGRTDDAKTMLRMLVQNVANKLGQGSSVEELCKHPPRDPNRVARVVIEMLDKNEESEWSPEHINRLLDKMDRQHGD